MTSVEERDSVEDGVVRAKIGNLSIDDEMAGRRLPEVKFSLANVLRRRELA